MQTTRIRLYVFFLALPHPWRIGFFPADSLPQPQYGGGSGQINTISCNGDETYLESCPGQNSFNVILCTHADDAGVICRKG